MRFKKKKYILLVEDVTFSLNSSHFLNVTLTCRLLETIQRYL